MIQTKPAKDMIVHKPCPKCGMPISLAQYGHYLSRELSGFKPWLEGWCANCTHRLLLPSPR